MDFSLDHAERLQASAGTYWVYVNQTMQVTPPYNSTIYTSLTILPGVIPFYWRAGITLLVEKVILNFVSINFHRKALAERLAEKKGGLGNRRRKKVVKSVTIHQVGEAIGQVALEHSQLHRRGEYGSLDSARKLAKNLFISLSDAHPPRDDLIVQGQACFVNVVETWLSTPLVVNFQISNHTSEQLRILYVQLLWFSISSDRIGSIPHLRCSARTVTVTSLRRRCERLPRQYIRNEKLLSLA